MIESSLKKNSEVGYRKPPKTRQFKKGQSGNPKGRPKAKTVSDMTPIMEAILAESVQILENGQLRTISNLEAIWRARIKRALSGDRRAIKVIFSYAQKAGLLSKVQQKSFLDRIEPEGEQGELLRIYHAEKHRLKFLLPPEQSAASEQAHETESVITPPQGQYHVDE